MRIHKIKISGFKSFVDPTTLKLSENLIGIVGPNGCGKSNVIDAVRWVMGESSAKHLRGDSMTDVIFNGSSSRQPVGLASVELIFDNADGAIGGQFAGFSEISIKRQVNREAVSSYYLNNTRCRRRDITTLLLGTGLGSRSYSVIEQGMISRVIEAKPEDLRVFLEEAAGISKYKERRRETEIRMRHTEDNIARLNDVRDEIGKQLARLTKQAEAAERYRTLKQEERRIEAELAALRWRALKHEAEQQERLVAREKNELEAIIAKLRAAESAIEQARDTRNDLNDQFNAVQSRYYALSSEISQLEQQLAHTKERQQSLAGEMEKIEADLGEVAALLNQDQNQRLALDAEYNEIAPRLSDLEEGEQQAQARLEASEQAMASFQSDWAEFVRQSAENERLEQITAARVEHLQSARADIQRRVEQILGEQQQLEMKDDAARIRQVEAEIDRRRAEYDQLAHRLTQHLERTAGARADSEAMTRERDELRYQMQQTLGRLASLETLQQSALKKDETSTSAGSAMDDAFAHLPRLAERLQVEHGWENAFESVLKDRLNGFCIKAIPALDLDGGPNGTRTLTLVEEHTGYPGTPDQGATPLRQKLAAASEFAHLLAGRYVADSVEEALTMRSRLAWHESYVTRAGDQIGRGWLKLNPLTDEPDGVLHREREIRQLKGALEALQRQLAACEATLALRKQAESALEEQSEQLRNEKARLQSVVSGHKESLAAHRAHFEQDNARLKRLAVDLTSLRQQTEEAEIEVGELNHQLGGHRAQKDAYAQARDALEQRRVQLLTALERQRRAWKTVHDERHAAALKTESLRSRRSALAETITRNQARIDQLTARREAYLETIAQSHLPLAQAQEALAQKLQARVAVETELAGQRGSVQDCDEKLRAYEQERGNLEHASQAARERLEEVRIASQSVLVKLQALADELTHKGFALEELLRDLEQADAGQWSARLAQLQRKIERLGAINLAAIDEVAELSERKTYLDQQHADLEQALATLKSAIAKIDQETRSRFKQTFDLVQQGLQEIFPQLFGGGRAYLELTENNLLETGVQVMARPPGKRNANIHQLSGGEKALTAVALVFSIFQLNPAPFCLLDEVDAPLDDANVVRYCEMLKRMSEKVQFLFISHNKLTIEIASELIGVTMHEAGVSRLVAVDVDEAVRMAAIG